MYGRVASVCKEWLEEMRGTPEVLLRLLCTDSHGTSPIRTQPTVVLCKALSLSAAKLKAYEHTLHGAFSGGHRYPMPATFHAVLRDHGGWEGVRTRATKNARRAIAGEKTRQAQRETTEDKHSWQALLAVLKKADELLDMLDDARDEAH